MCATLAYILRLSRKIMLGRKLNICIIMLQTLHFPITIKDNSFNQNRTPVKGVLRTLSKILDWTFFAKIKPLTIFIKKLRLRCLTGSCYTSVIYRKRPLFCIRSYSGLHFPAFALNTERYSVSFRIQSECGKIRTIIIPNPDTFFTVNLFYKSSKCGTYSMKTSW